MYYTPTQIDLNLVTQPTKDIFVKIDLLMKNFKTIDSLECNLISDNLSVDGESKQRRSYTCELQVSDPSFLVGADRKIWIDKYIRVSYGIRNLRTKEIHWYELGIFSYQSVDYSYDATTNLLSLKCVDLMADYDGTKNGQFVYKNDDGEYITDLILEKGQSISNAVITTLDMAGIIKYEVEDMVDEIKDESGKIIKVQKELPYDLEFNGTFTYCDVWTKICELYPGWEFFFDVDGTFIWRKMPTGLHEPVIFDNAFLDKILISENISYDFSKIYNKTIVWGKVLELEYDDRYTEECAFKDGVYSIKLAKLVNQENYGEVSNPELIESLDEIDHLDQIGIKISANSIGNDKIKINDLDPLPIVHDDGTPIKASDLKKNQVYVFSYRRNLGETIQNCLYLLGQYQCYGEYTEQSLDCPFSVPNLGYVIVNRVDYDNLYSDDLCYNQAEYLNYQTTVMQDTLDLSCLIIPWLDVNEKIEYKPRQAEKKSQYIIKNFSWSSLDGTMSMTLYKFLEDFEYVKKDK